MSSRVSSIAIAAGLALAGTLLAGTHLAAPGAQAQGKGVVNVFNWSDYVADDTLSSFTSETGIAVNYDVYDSTSVANAKIGAGSSGYDMAVLAGVDLRRMIASGAIQPIDKAKLSNYGNLDPKLLARLEKIDPGNAHSVPYMWGTTGIGYNVDMVKARLGDEVPESWALVFDPEVAGKLADCGISLLDEANEVYAAMLAYLGEDPTTTDIALLEKAHAALEAARPNIRTFNSGQYISDLATGEICVAMGYNGDILQARDRAAEAANNVDISYVMPKEGLSLWFDLMTVPAGAPNFDNGHAFIDYILQPQVAADITNTVFFANPNTAASPLVDAEVMADPAVYPPPELLDKTFVLDELPPDVLRSLNRLWTRLKAGR